MDTTQILWKIYEYEKEIETLKDKKEFLGANKNLEELSESLNEKKYDITNFKTQLEVDDMKIKRLNHKLKEINFQIKDINSKLYSGDISNVKKLTKLQKEETDLKQEKEKLENEILELMENVETNTKELYNSEKTYEQLQTKYKNSEKDNIKILNDIKEQIKELENKVQKLKSTLDDEILSKYENLKTKKTKPISKLDDDKCTGCHMSIPSVVVSKVKKGKEVVYCDNCGRMLYYEQENN